MGKKKRKLVLTKIVGPPPPPKRHTTIGKSLKKPIEVEPVFVIKIIEPQKVNEEEDDQIKWQRIRQIS